MEFVAFSNDVERFVGVSVVGVSVGTGVVALVGADVVVLKPSAKSGVELVGVSVGTADGKSVGTSVGTSDSLAVGTKVGVNEGAYVNPQGVGGRVGESVAKVGAGVGTTDGRPDGADDGWQQRQTSLVAYIAKYTYTCPFTSLCIRPCTSLVYTCGHGQVCIQMWACVCAVFCTRVCYAGICTYLCYVHSHVHAHIHA